MTYSLFATEISQQGEGTYQDIFDDKNNEASAIPYWAWYEKCNEIIKLLSDNKEDKNIKFAWPLIKDQIGMCRAFVSSKKIEISPECIPINSFGIFNNADHRILMSATTQEDTLFIKGMGYR
jgi:predicted nucleic acid binding AN1-type Zn finger protein